MPRQHYHVNRSRPKYREEGLAEVRRGRQPERIVQGRHDRRRPQRSRKEAEYQRRLRGILSPLSTSPLQGSTWRGPWRAHPSALSPVRDSCTPTNVSVLSFSSTPPRGLGSAVGWSGPLDVELQTRRDSSVE